MTKTSIVHSSEEQGSSASEKERDVPIAMVKEDGGDEEVNVRVQGRQLQLGQTKARIETFGAKMRDQAKPRSN